MLQPAPLQYPGEPDLVLSGMEVGAVPLDAPEGEVLAEYPPRQHEQKMYWLVENSGGYLLRFPNYAEFTIARGVREVAWARAAHVPVEDVLEMFSGNVISLLLGLSGEAVFHASAVAFRSPSGNAAFRAAAAFGSMGVGKSTTAAVLVATGGRFLTDDVLRVRIDSDGPTVVGGCSELRLRSEAWPLADRIPGVSRRHSDGRLVLAIGGADLSSTPLGLLVFPKLVQENDNLGGGLKVRKLRSNETALRLAAAPRMSGWALKRVLENQFSCLAQLAGSVPAVELEIPRGGGLSEAFGVGLREAILQLMSWG